MVQSSVDDIQRLRQEYASRAQRFEGSELYSPFNPAQLFTLQQRQRDVLTVLKKHHISPLGKTVLELGCGTGGVLQEFLGFGFSAKSLHGTELMADRVKQAHKQLAHLPLTNADGRYLPYASASFDLVLQYTVFSSVLDNAIKRSLAQEMLRVLRSDGLILWYDFWLNPTNPQTRGIRPAEIRLLFPGCSFEFHKITLAPPIARRLIPISWVLCTILDKIRIFNTHYMVSVRPA